jgi:hypothetical protein
MTGTARNWVQNKPLLTPALAKVSSDEDHAASHDALMVFLVGFPTSGGGVNEQVAYLKGQQIALRNALMSHGCTGLR